ncbi:MAG: hypothetical protein KGD64_05150, partial [Candidatus Heimdallarchaeota archaeon]|nr:hypothetical protein [Candidatus Heimdallarchaeota archaeon]
IDTLEDRIERKKGELISKYDINGVKERKTAINQRDKEAHNLVSKEQITEISENIKKMNDRKAIKCQKEVDSDNIEIMFKNFVKATEIEQWRYIRNLYPNSNCFNYEAFEKFVENSCEGKSDLREEDVKILTYFYELCNVNITSESKRFEIVKTLKDSILNGVIKENSLLSTEETEDGVSLRIKNKHEHIKIGTYNKNDFMNSGFVRALDFILIENVESILKTNILTGFHLKKDGTPNKSQPIYTMLKILLENLRSNDYLKDLFFEKLREYNINPNREFAKVYQQLDEDYIIKWSNALSSFKERLVNDIMSEKYLLTSRFKEILQLSNEFIEAISLINCPKCIESYKKLKTFEIQSYLQSGIKKHILNTGNEFLRLDISEEGIVTEVKLSLEDNSLFTSKYLISQLFENYRKWVKSVTGADGITIGKKHHFDRLKNGFIRRLCEMDTIILIENKMRSSLGNISPFLHGSNLVRKYNMEYGETDFKILKELDYTIYAPTKLELSSSDEIANITMDIPFGGTMGCRRVMETFQKMFSLYPSHKEYFTREEFFEKIGSRSIELNMNLKLLLQKLTLKKSILSFFQGEPCVKTDKDALIGLDDSKIVSLRTETDSFANLSKLRGINGFQYCTSFFVPDGIKLRNGDIVGEGKKSLLFFNKFGENDSLTEYDIKMSIYTGSKNQIRNCIQINTSDNKIIFLSPTIFFSENNRKYYVLTNDGRALYAETYTKLKDEIYFFFKEKNSNWIKANNFELTSFYAESDESTYYYNTNMKFDSNLDKDKITMLCLLKLQNMLLNGFFIGKKLQYGINLFNSSLIPLEQRTYHNYSPDISFYFSIFTTSTNTKLPLLKEKVDNNHNIFSIDHFTEKDKKMLFVGCDYCNLDRNLERFIGNSEILNKIGIFEQSEFENYRTLIESNINFKTIGMVLYSSLQLIYYLNLYYGKMAQDEVIPYVLPLSYNYMNRQTKIYIEVQQSRNLEYKYDLSNLVEYLNTHKKNTKISKHFTGKHPLGCYNPQEDVFIQVKELFDYHNNSLQDKKKQQIINSLIESNKNKIVSSVLSDSFVNPLQSNRVIAPYLPVTIRYDELEEYNYLTISKYNIDGMFRTLENSTDRRESSVYILDDNFDKRLKEMFGLNRDELTKNKGIKQLYLRAPELKEALTLMYIRLHNNDHYKSSFKVGNFTDINHIRLFIGSYFKQYEGKRDKRTRLYNLNNRGETSLQDQIVTLLSSFVFRLYDCITCYGHYVHSLEHLKSNKNSARDDTWIYRNSVNLESMTRHEWNKFLTWYTNINPSIDKKISNETITDYLSINKITKKTNPFVYEIFVGLQRILEYDVFVPIVNDINQSISAKVFATLYEYIKADKEKLDQVVKNSFNLLNYAFYDTLIRIWSSLMNIGTKKSKLYFQSVNETVREIINAITDSNVFTKDMDTIAIISLEKARILSYVTNTRLIQRPY